MTVETWLAEAAMGLAPEARAKVEREVRERPELLHEDAQVAKARLEKQYLTMKDAAKIDDAERQERTSHRFIAWNLGLYAAFCLSIPLWASDPGALLPSAIWPPLTFVAYLLARPHVATGKPRPLARLYEGTFGLWMLFLTVTLSITFMASPDIRAFLWLTLAFGTIAMWADLRGFEKRYSATLA